MITLMMTLGISCSLILLIIWVVCYCIKNGKRIEEIRSVREYLFKMGLIKTSTEIPDVISGTTRFVDQLVDDLARDLKCSGSFGSFVSCNNQYRILGNKVGSRYNPEEYQPYMAWLSYFCNLVKDHEPLFFMVIKYQRYCGYNNYYGLKKSEIDADIGKFYKWACHATNMVLSLSDITDQDKQIVEKLRVKYNDLLECHVSGVESSYSDQYNQRIKPQIEKQREIYSLFDTDEPSKQSVESKPHLVSEKYLE